MRYGSLYSKDELTARWDDITSPARFAGANEQLDWIYNASRKGDRVKLVKKPRAAYDPFATVFRGKISERKISGVFTKGLFDYIITAAVSGVYFGVCAEYFSRAENRIIPSVFISVGILAVLLALIPLPGKRKKYGKLIRKVTGPSPDRASAQPAPAPEENETGAPPETEDERYKFRVFGRKK